MAQSKRPDHRHMREQTARSLAWLQGRRQLANYMQMRVNTGLKAIGWQAQRAKGGQGCLALVDRTESSLPFNLMVGKKNASQTLKSQSACIGRELTCCIVQLSLEAEVISPRSPSLGRARTQPCSNIPHPRGGLCFALRRCYPIPHFLQREPVSIRIFASLGENS